jgi:hypothetical protein
MIKDIPSVELLEICKHQKVVKADMSRVKEKLGIFIQDRTADLGHSSAEDAKAALDLLKWRVRDDKDD